MDQHDDRGESTGVDRRSVLLGGLALTGALALAAAQIWSRVARADAALAVGPHASLLDALCDLVIPGTETPGARSVGVPQFVALAVGHGLNGSRPENLDQVRALLDQRGTGSFLELAPASQSTTLEVLDAEAYAPAAIEAAHFASGFASWRVIKGLILMGYYTSETGATQELRFQPVPGRFDADIRFEPGQPALMNDWYGNAF
jgi:hypothetical protein